MGCRTCGEPAAGACGRCGAFYCARHGGVVSQLGQAYCVACYERVRPMFAGLGVIALASGLVALALGLVVLGESAWGWSLVLIGSLTVGASLWRLAGLFGGFPKRSG